MYYTKHIIIKKIFIRKKFSELLVNNIFRINKIFHLLNSYSPPSASPSSDPESPPESPLPSSSSLVFEDVLEDDDFVALFINIISRSNNINNFFISDLFVFILFFFAFICPTT